MRIWKQNLIETVKLRKQGKPLSFIHTPKCAGSFAKKICNDLGIEKIVGHNLPSDNSAIYFTIIRHPINRFQSLMYYRLSGLFPKGGSCWPPHLIDVIDDDSVDLDTVLSRMSDAEITGFHPFGTLRYWSSSADIIISIDEMRDLLQSFGFDLDLKKYPNKLNVSLKTRPPFTKVSRDRLENIFREDIEFYQKWTREDETVDILKSA